MRRAAIVMPLRTPVGAYDGALKSVPVEALGATVTSAVVERSQPEARFGRTSGTIETAENLARDFAIARAAADAYAVRSQHRAAAVCLLVDEDQLAELKLEPTTWMVGWAAAGCEPSRMGIGPVPAVTKPLARTGLSFAQMDLIERNEAFSCQVLDCVKGLGASMEALEAKPNVNGSGISLGRPVGATGVRILATLLNGLHRQRTGHCGDLRARVIDGDADA